MKKNIIVKAGEYEIKTGEYPVLIIQGKIFNYRYLEKFNLQIDEEKITTEKEFWKFLFMKQEEIDMEFFNSMAEEEEEKED